MIFGAIASVVGGVVGAIGAGKAKRKAEAEQAAAQKELNKMKSAYQNIDTSNPYANIENQFAGLTNHSKD